MRDLTIDERYSEFVRTVNEIGCGLLKEDDEIIENIFFEEYPVDIVSFFHHNTLTDLIDNGYIDNAIMVKALHIRQLFLEYEEIPELYNLHSIKSDERWRQLLQESDELKKLLYM